MRRAVFFGIAVYLAARPASADGPQAALRDVASREIVLSIALGNQASIERIRVWCTPDGGAHWEELEPFEHLGASVAVRAPGEGEFGYFLVAENAAGASSVPPAAATPPHIRVRVDLTPPVLQLHEACLRTVAGLHSSLRVRASVVEENLGSQGLRLFARGADGSWVDAGSGELRDGWVVCDLPAAYQTVSAVRLVASDRAGNSAIETIERVQVEEIEPHSPTTNEAHQEPARTADGAGHDAKPDVEPVKPVAPVSLTPDSGPNGSAAAGDGEPREPETGDQRQTERLRTLAQQHLDVGEYELAAARLEEALRSAPDDADLLVSLGSALYRTGRYDQAAERYEAAVRRRADHLAAIEGLALVDATRRRYPQAREHLKRLLALSPESADAWMHLGDVEHRLGETGEALRAWNRALGIKDVPPSVTEGVQRRLRLLGPARRAAESKEESR
ncbi:MAG: Beta-barrel assembly-enhancing protease [Phycisphaerae bacterium]|nr:Beta-barrel assembly-enhancing protease [Phycisphaerae bacterium]